jgi:tRNA U34 5-carboxymethylaminomethyl modifying GTPase MnmE/TrmE
MKIELGFNLTVDLLQVLVTLNTIAERASPIIADLGSDVIPLFNKEDGIKAAEVAKKLELITRLISSVTGYSSQTMTQLKETIRTQFDNTLKKNTELKLERAAQEAAQKKAIEDERKNAEEEAKRKEEETQKIIEDLRKKQATATNLQ